MQEAIASKEATIRQVGISIIGVTLFLLLFSIITFASTIITNIATKKREYAMFQSIGMTRKQTEKMALCESCVLAIGSLILTLILGIILGQLIRSIRVMGKDELHIEFNYQDEYQKAISLAEQIATKNEERMVS